jgi:hypothetical protein
MKAKNSALLAGLIALGAWSASAQTTTIYSGSDFSTMAAYNGIYVPGSPGYEALSYASPDVDAVVGVRGPLGALDQLTMSFDYSNLSGGSGNAPFAAFGVSLDGTWGTGGQEFDIISEDGNQLTGTSLVHVWDFSLNGGDGGDVAGLSGVTLDSILGVDNSYNGVAFGDLEVMRAYAYIGDEGASSGSVDINSITVVSAPDGASTLFLLGIGFAGLAVFGVRQHRLQVAK